jgi:hypothetical protein
MAIGQIESDALQRGPLFRMSHAVGSATILAIACLLSYWLITTVLTREYSVSRDDDLLGVCGRPLPLSLCTAAATRRVLAPRCRVQLQRW